LRWGSKGELLKMEIESPRPIEGRIYTLFEAKVNS